MDISAESVDRPETPNSPDNCKSPELPGSIVEYSHLWSVKLTELESGKLDDPVYGQNFCTNHDGLGYIWYLELVRNERRPQDLLLYFCFKDGPKSKCYLDLSSFLVVNGAKREETSFVRHNMETEREKMSVEGLSEAGRQRIEKQECARARQLGDPDPKSVFVRCFDLEQLKSQYMSNGSITFGLDIKIPKKNFCLYPWEGFPTDLEERSSSKFYEELWGNTELVPLDKYKGEENIERPKSDFHKLLDCQIYTNDGYVLWCHKLLIVSECNPFTADIVRAIRQTNTSSLYVGYSSGVMMEIVHYLYNKKPTKDLAKLPVEELMNAINYYELPLLKARMEHKLVKEMNQDNYVKLLVLADMCGLKVLKNKLINYLGEHLYTTYTSEDGQKLSDAIWMDAFENNDARQRVQKVYKEFSDIFSD